MCRRYFVMKWLTALGRGRKTQQSQPCEILSLTPLNTPCKRPCGLISFMRRGSLHALMDPLLIGSYVCSFASKIGSAPALLVGWHMTLLQIVACIARQARVWMMR